jgi:transposase
VYVFAAVCAALGKMTALILPFVNIHMMNIFLHHVSQDFKDFFVIMIVDQAAWHTSKRLKIPENIRLIAQPSHSPELNPVEHIWEEIREKAMPNVALKSLDEVEQRLCQELIALENDPDRLRSMTNFPHLRFTC